MNPLLPPSPIPHLVLDDRLRVVALNAACERVMEQPRAEILGTRAHRAFLYGADLPTLADILVKEDGAPPPTLNGQPVVQGLLPDSWETIAQRRCSRRLWRCLANRVRLENGVAAAVMAMLPLTDENGAALPAGAADNGLIVPQSGQAAEDGPSGQPAPCAPAAAGRVRLGPLVGKSRAMRWVYSLVEKAGDCDESVLITGESGTGKEVVARAIHALGGRKNRPFVAVNCGAIPAELLESEFFGYRKGAFTGACANKPGLLDQADGGTLFLDEVAELPQRMQVKLLRFLDGKTFTPLGSTMERSVNVRVIAATNRDVDACVADGSMREDFFFRLLIIPIHLPPLRERTEDIPLLLDEFARNAGAAPLPEHVTRAFMRRHWPGNIRELQNSLRRWLALGELDAPCFLKLPDPLDPAAPDAEGINLRTLRREFEARLIRSALARTRGKRGEAARLLGLSERTFFRKLADDAKNDSDAAANGTRITT